MCDKSNEYSFSYIKKKLIIPSDDSAKALIYNAFGEIDFIGYGKNIAKVSHSMFGNQTAFTLIATTFV